MTEQEKTIAEIESTMREWIKKQLPIYDKLPAAQTMTTVQGEKVLKANPASQEIRAAFKDYCYIVKVQSELNGGERSGNIETLDDFRKKYKIAK